MRVEFAWVLLVLIFFPTISHSKILCIGEEKHALLDFKLSFVADPDGALSSWSADNLDCCDWAGVQCDNHTGHVVSLRAGDDLGSHQLRPSLLVLQHLTSLDLSGNDFSMAIPQFIGSLSKLTYLDLWLSGFSGKIPPYLGNLTKLQHLSLGDSSGLHADNMRWLSRLSSLNYLDMGGVDLSNATDWLSTLKMLPSLSTFNCSACSLPPLPPLSSMSFGNQSTHLQVLDLSYNSISHSVFSNLTSGTHNLTGVHLTYMKLEQSLDGFLETLVHSARYTLEVLNIEGNSLTRLTPQLMIFPSLKKLFMSHNQLNQLSAQHFQYMLNLNSLDVSYNLMNTLPDLSKITSMEYLDASFNKISAIVPHLPPNLVSLDLSANSLNDIISDAHFSKLSQLYFLFFSGNYVLSFNFSESWVPPFQLGALSLRSCQIGPSFPNWILKQQSLFYLDISNSSISGAIPTSVWNIRLAYLNVSNNRFQYTIPDLAFTPLIGAVDLSSNEFYGPIPRFLFSAKLTLDLSNNRFSSFPSFHHDVSNHDLLQIKLSNNLLSGSLPYWIFQFDDLIILNLANNMLSGTIPSNIGFLWQLNALHLNNNSFSGELPSSMKNCSQLIILELENNHLSASVPLWLGENLLQLIVLSLSSNNLSGELPSNLCFLQNLQVLDLSGNKISGSIPSCVSNFTSMATYEGFNTAFFILFNNYLAHKFGHWGLVDFASVTWKGVSVPESGAILPQLNVMDLSNNLLTGEIPAAVTCLKYLRSLDLSKNNLDGSIPDKIGLIVFLEVLNLSSNRLSGEIPKSLGGLTFLDKLNLSRNNLYGRIPDGPQLRTFDISAFAGNPELCGEPLPTKCRGENYVEQQPTPYGKDQTEPFDMEAFYGALGIGFGWSFLGILGILHFHTRSRHAFFQMASDVADWVFVRTSLCQSRIKMSCYDQENEG